MIQFEHDLRTLLQNYILHYEALVSGSKYVRISLC